MYHGQALCGMEWRAYRHWREAHRLSLSVPLPFYASGKGCSGGINFFWEAVWMRTIITMSSSALAKISVAIFAHSESMRHCLYLLSCASSCKSISVHGPSSSTGQDTEVIMPASVRRAKIFLSKQAAGTDYRRVPFLGSREKNDMK